MSNRILKESICTSASVDALSWFEEAFFYRLIVNADDYGRMDARIPILRARLFPLRQTSQEQIEAALAALERVGILRLYKCGNMPFLQLLSWEKHQHIRAKRSRYPAPENSCMQMLANDCSCSLNPIQSESQFESESESEVQPESNPPEGEEIDREIIDYLNEKAGTSFRPQSAKTHALIAARRKEGYTLSQFKLVIDKKCVEWGREPRAGEKDMRPYLRPQTLFGQHFESYVNQKEAVRTPGQNASAKIGEHSSIDMEKLSRMMQMDAM